MNKPVITLLALTLNSALVANVLGDELSDCACVTTPATSSAAIGTITDSNGDVLYSDASGYAQAKSGAQLVAGSQVSVGDRSAAFISVGKSCKLKISSNSIASLEQEKNDDSKICVKVTNLSDPANSVVQEGSSTQQSTKLDAPQFFMASFVGLVTGAALATGIGDEAASN